MTVTITKEGTAWKLPDLDTVYHCEELGPMIPGQMLDGVVPDLMAPTRPCTRTYCGPSAPETCWKR